MNGTTGLRTKTVTGPRRPDAVERRRRGRLWRQPDRNEPDYYPEDPNQWNDADEDGHADFYTFDDKHRPGENQSGDHSPTTARSGTIPTGTAGVTTTPGRSTRPPTSGTRTGMPSGWMRPSGRTWTDGYGGNYTCIWSNATMTCTESGDDFPYDATQWSDLDNDGYGDNLSGNNPDPNLFDSDNDGYNNTADEFPWNPTQWEDADGDGLGDNTNGTNADPYPDDTDNDGYNNSADAFPFDSTQWEDADGDGYGDNQSGNYPDHFMY